MTPWRSWPMRGCRKGTAASASSTATRSWRTTGRSCASSSRAASSHSSAAGTWCCWPGRRTRSRPQRATRLGADPLPAGVRRHGRPAGARVTLFEPPPPRAWVARCVRPGGALEARQPDFPRTACITRERAAGIRSPCRPGPARIVAEGAGWLTVNASGPGWLVTTQPWYPGWHAARQRGAAPGRAGRRCAGRRAAAERQAPGPAPLPSTASASAWRSRRPWRCCWRLSGGSIDAPGTRRLRRRRTGRRVAGRDQAPVPLTKPMRNGEGDGVEERAR